MGLTGSILTAAIVLHVVFATAAPGASLVFRLLGDSLLVGLPLGLPWLLLLASRVTWGRETLSWDASIVTIVLILAEGALLVPLPRLLSDSEGFFALVLWGAGVGAYLLLMTLFALDRRPQGTR